MTPSGAGGRTQLTDGDVGSWVVTTLTSCYLLDLDAREITRQPGGGNPGPYGWDSGPPEIASLRRDREAVPVHAVAHCHLGEPLVLLLDLRGDGVVTIRRSTQVVAIDPADAASR